MWMLALIIVIAVIVYVVSRRPATNTSPGPSEADIVGARGFAMVCALLGSAPDFIREILGSPDDEYTNDYGTRFLFYGSHQALFTMDADSGKAKYVSWPRANARGGRSTSAIGDVGLLGIKLGDTREVVRQKWGPATNEAACVWLYANKRGATRVGSHYEVAIEFAESGGNVSGLEGRLVGESHFV
jgi:hypothetical protein